MRVLCLVAGAALIAATSTGNQSAFSGFRGERLGVMHPQTGQVWVSVNERDALDDNLVPDYISSEPRTVTT